MKKYALLAGLLIGGSIAIANASPNLTGTYACTGVNNLGSATTRIDGKFALSKNGFVYNVSQLDSKTGKPIKNDYVEIAVQQADHLAIAYQQQNNPNALGVESMKIIDKHPIKLSGIFVDSTQPNKAGHEVCIQVK